MFNFMHCIAGGRLLAAIAALAITLGGIYAFLQFWIISRQYLL